MTVFLTGATGFVGGYILRELLRQGHTVRCLVRNDAPALDAIPARVEQVSGSVTAPDTLRGVMDGCDAVIHLVGIIRERPARGVTFDAIHFGGTKAVVDEARKAGIPRCIQMSANGARRDGVSAYQTSKWHAEEYVRQAGFSHWTIFRPSLIFGDPGPGGFEFASELARTLVRPFPVLPVFGNGRFEMQPVSVEEVAAAFVQALALDAAHGKVYHAGGQERITFLELLDRITDAIGHARKLKIPNPSVLVRPAIRFLDGTGILPVSLDQFDMLMEGNTCDSTAFYQDFDLAFKPFSPENLSYLNRREKSGAA